MLIILFLFLQSRVFFQTMERLLCWSMNTDMEIASAERFAIQNKISKPKGGRVWDYKKYKKYINIRNFRQVGFYWKKYVKNIFKVKYVQDKHKNYRKVSRFYIFITNCLRVFQNRVNYANFVSNFKQQKLRYTDRI